MHTAQVVQIAIAHAAVARQYGKPLSEDVIIVAGIFHDTGKMEDYVLDSSGASESYSAHYSHVGHLPRSYHNFLVQLHRAEARLQMKLDPAIALAIQHCILSHHGCPEWGSAKVPATREAHCLHHADMLSAYALEERKKP